MLWLASPSDQPRRRWVQRFDPRYWTVDFPRPMMAALTTVGADGLDVRLTFQRTQDLAGLIWHSADPWSHPLLAYETRRDYRGLVLRFRWQAFGALKPLDAVHGPTLTIEGRTEAGTPRTWYVRLWNYAVGTPTDAVITLDFDALAGGFLHPSEADPVWAGAIDRLFLSLVPAAYDGTTTGPLGGGAQSARVELRDITLDGAGATIAAGDVLVPPHPIRMAGGYDDVYNQTPERLVEALVHLGYRGRLDHYLGMSHFPKLAWDGAAFRVDSAATDPLDPCAAAWHADFFAHLKAHGFTVILSLSVELFDAYAPDAWKQRAHDGTPAQTGWSPPSTLLSPASAAAMDWLGKVLKRVCALAHSAGVAFEAQIGEPWWWVPTDGAREPCLYDASITAAYTAATGLPVPPAITSATQTLSAAQLAYVQWCGAKLGSAVLALRDGVRTQHPGPPVSVLIYTPQILDAAAPWLADLNIPVSWARPAFSALQREDYDYVITANWGARTAGQALLASRLGYPPTETDSYAGFVLNAADAHQWQAIAQALADDAGVRDRFVWAYPQIVRDGVVLQDFSEEADLAGFHDVLFPLHLGFGSRGGPEFSTTVVASAAGLEQRNANWAQARRSYDVSTGLRSQADLMTLIAFFEARLGRAYGFRFRDPHDSSSSNAGQPLTPFDQVLGTGDGSRTRFWLTKSYGSQRRRITRPVAGSVRVGVNGVEATTGWTLDLATGALDFAAAPASGASVTAGFSFDVPVRFADDRLSVSVEDFAAGAVPAIGLTELREG
jgi:uncharacterized protein (TIGR02217 family)